MFDKIRVWLVREGETLPIDSGEQRLFRMGLICNEFQRIGSEVTWFTSTFDHNKKTFRFNESREVKINDDYHLYLLHGRYYKKNISVGRLLHYYDEKKAFHKVLISRQKPDVIIAAMPNIELANEAVRYGKCNNVPVFVDVRDMWPELYEEYFPKYKSLVHYAIIPFKKQLAWTLKNATGIIATSDKFLEWALKYAGREKGPNDNYYYVSYPDTNVELTNEDYQYWYEMGLSEEDTICCFFGQFGHAVDLEPVMYAALKTAKQNPKIKYVICGVGEKLKDYKKIIDETDNVIFPGWVNRRQICALGTISSVGLLSYRKNKNYEWSMPNKFCEYLALGLAMLVEPTGMMADLIAEHQIGYRYDGEHELSEKLLYLADHKDVILSMKKRARRLYEQKFKADVVYSQLVADIRKTIKK